MILTQDPDTGWYTQTADGRTMVNVHQPYLCEDRGCAIHNHPSEHSLMHAPLNWRGDRGILERICEHGVGHPDHDAALFLESIGRGYENVHGCDGCCTTVES